MFWFGAGIAAGVAVSRKVNETKRKATPDGMAEQIGGALSELADAVGSFGADVRTGMQEREREIEELVAEDDRPARLLEQRDEPGRARGSGR